MAAGTTPTLWRVALPEVTIYTDGACSGNGRSDPRGGWAAVLTAPGAEPKQLSGGEKPATNQRMELTAAIEGLNALKTPCRVVLYADSAYLVNGMNDRWYLNWRRNGWKNSKRQPVANQDLWEQLADLVESHGHDVRFEKVTGHADRARGHVSSEHEALNQLCDQLAVAAVPA
jgi:ribonuclease HI